MTDEEFATAFCLPAVLANALVPNLARYHRNSVWHKETDFVGADPEHVLITFERGVPVAVDGETVTVLQAIAELNWLIGGGPQPGAAALIAAHRQLEDRTVERDLLAFKRRIEPQWAELVEQGQWFSPLREALDAFIITSQEHVTGEVHLDLRDRLSPAA
jgi:argininosuccinate synthase